MRIENEIKLDFKDVLVRPKRSTLGSRSEVDLNRSFKLKARHSIDIDCVPIIAANMDTVGTFEMAKAFYKHNMMVSLHKFYSEDELVTFFRTPESTGTFYTLGISDSDLDKFRSVHNKLQNGSYDYLFMVCIDVANGYSERFNDFIKNFKNEFPDLIIMAGNVVTGEMTEELILSGADIVKVGIGSGSVCTTRKMTGVGYPQLSAIIECADAAHGLGALICGDGGITCPGDIVKAMGAGADFVMCGGLFAGHDECGGEITGVTKYIKPDVTSQIITNSENFNKQIVYSFRDNVGQYHHYEIDIQENIQNKSMPNLYETVLEKLPSIFFDIKIDKDAKMKFYGMSSDDAMNKHYNGKANYRASEGKTVLVDYRGPVENTINEILGGLRSACTYVGAKSLKQLSKCTTFVRVTQQLNEVFK